MGAPANDLFSRCCNALAGIRVQVIIAEARQADAAACSARVPRIAGLDSHWKSPGGRDMRRVDESERFEIAPSLMREFRTALPVSAHRTAPLALPRKDEGASALGPWALQDSTGGVW